MGYGPGFESELHVVLVKGEVVRIDQIQNDKTTMPEYCDRQAEEIRRRCIESFEQGGAKPD